MLSQFIFLCLCPEKLSSSSLLQLLAFITDTVMRNKEKKGDYDHDQVGILDLIDSTTKTAGHLFISIPLFLIANDYITIHK